jgi:hypothetical protein
VIRLKMPDASARVRVPIGVFWNVTVVAEQNDGPIEFDRRNTFRAGFRIK